MLGYHREQDLDLFLGMINDLSSTLPRYKYVDDVTVFEVAPLSSIEPPVLQRELDKICKWTSSNNMKLNGTKSKEFIISFVKDPKLLDPLTVNSLPLESINTTKLLGVHLSSDLKWSTHVEAVCAKASKRLFALRSLKRSGVSPRDLRSVYSYFIRPVLEYACPVWHTSLPRKLSDQLEQIQRCALHIIVPHLSYTNGLNEWDLTTLEERRESLCKYFYKNNLITASKLCSLSPHPVDHYYNLRNPRKLPLYKCRNNRFSNSFLPYCVRKLDANP